MKITGSEKLKDLEKYCCPTADDSQDYLIIDDKCIHSLLEECRRICLSDFAVPVDEIVEMTKDLESGQTLSLEDFRVVVIYVVNNESLLYRHIDGYTIEDEVMRYKYDSSVVIDDINFGESVPAKLTFSLSTNNSPVIINWANIADVIVDHESYDVWSKAINTWRNMSPERVTNTLILPNFESEIDINLFLDETENRLSNTIEFEIGSDDIKFTITAYVEYNIDTDVSVFDITSVKLSGKFIDPNIIYIQDAVDHIFESPKVTINNTGDFVTLNAKNFSSLKSLLILSSETIIKKLELFNDNSVTRRVKILLAK